jgi:hypothetical protein
MLSLKEVHTRENKEHPEMKTGNPCKSVQEVEGSKIWACNSLVLRK